MNNVLNRVGALFTTLIHNLAPIALITGLIYLFFVSDLGTDFQRLALSLGLLALLVASDWIATGLHKDTTTTGSIAA